MCTSNESKTCSFMHFEEMSSYGENTARYEKQKKWHMHTVPNANLDASEKGKIYSNGDTSQGRHMQHVGIVHSKFQQNFIKYKAKTLLINILHKWYCCCCLRYWPWFLLRMNTCEKIGNCHLHFYFLNFFISKCVFVEVNPDIII